VAVFKDSQEVYDTIGRLLVELAADPEMGPKFRKANTIVRYEHTDPEAVITVRLQESEPGEVDFGESEMEPEVTMTMAADIAHAFWLGQVNVTVALARGQIRAEGPVAKILKLAPLAKPAFPRYKALLVDGGRGDLVEPPEVPA
jgi:putative sterol carrier protein